MIGMIGKTVNQTDPLFSSPWDCCHLSFFLGHCYLFLSPQFIRVLSVEIFTTLVLCQIMLKVNFVVKTFERRCLCVWEDGAMSTACTICVVLLCHSPH